MNLIVDTNILFSACLTPDGRIFEVLFNTSLGLQITSCHYAIQELNQHKEKLIKLSHHSPHDVETLLITILKQVEFFDENIIEKRHWLKADILTKGIDSKDINFVALALQTDGLLWTGDKKLTNHLKSLNFNSVINTTELCEMLGIGK